MFAAPRCAKTGMLLQLLLLHTGRKVAKFAGNDQTACKGQWKEQAESTHKQRKMHNIVRKSDLVTIDACSDLDLVTFSLVAMSRGFDHRAKRLCLLPCLPGFRIFPKVRKLGILCGT